MQNCCTLLYLKYMLGFNSTLTKTLACLSRRCLCKQWDLWRYFSPENKYASVSISCYFFHIVSEATDSWSHIMCLSFHVWGTLWFKSLEMNTYDGENMIWLLIYTITFLSCVCTHDVCWLYSVCVLCASFQTPCLESNLLCKKVRDNWEDQRWREVKTKGCVGKLYSSRLLLLTFDCLSQFLEKKMMQIFLHHFQSISSFYLKLHNCGKTSMMLHPT